MMFNLPMWLFVGGLLAFGASIIGNAWQAVIIFSQKLKYQHLERMAEIEFRNKQLEAAQQVIEHDQDEHQMRGAASGLRLSTGRRE